MIIELPGRSVFENLKKNLQYIQQIRAKIENRWNFKVVIKPNCFAPKVNFRSTCHSLNRGNMVHFQLTKSIHNSAPNIQSQ